MDTIMSMLLIRLVHLPAPQNKRPFRRLAFKVISLPLHVATLFSPRTGICLDLTTSEPALVVYAGGYLEKAKLPNTKSREVSVDHDHQPNKHVVVKAEFDKFAGISLEPIRYPDTIHHREWSKMVTLHHDQEYRQKSIYKFSVVPQTL
jgi:galactose mutarotase-like enzyme